MATKKISGQKFSVTGSLKLQVGVDVMATNMEEALAEARNLKVQDFISFGDNDHIDSETEITAIYKND